MLSLSVNFQYCSFLVYFGVVLVIVVVVVTGVKQSQLLDLGLEFDNLDTNVNPWGVVKLYVLNILLDAICPKLKVFPS